MTEKELMMATQMLAVKKEVKGLLHDIIDAEVEGTRTRAALQSLVEMVAITCVDKHLGAEEKEALRLEGVKMVSTIALDIIYKIEGTIEASLEKGNGTFKAGDNEFRIE